MNELFDFNTSIVKAVSDIQIAEKIKEKTVWSIQMKGSSPYQFCPKCMKKKLITLTMMKKFFELKDKTKKTTDESDFCQRIKTSGLQPLMDIRKKELVKVSDDFGQVMYNSYLECPLCKEEITIEDFESAYCAPPKEDTCKKYIELNNYQEMERF
ncbi:MAG: hypothetical protein KBT21_08605 [Treponema sp.]|nr:hypothetical protein [Candidatus Treponema merdequi]